MYRRYFVDNLPKTTHRPFVRLSKTALRTGHWRQRSVLLCLISSQHIWYFAYRQHTKNRRRRVNVILECRAQQMIASLNKAIINIRSRLAAALWWVGLAYAVFPSPMPGHCVHWKCDVGTKPETHNILQCGQRRTEPRPRATCVEKFHEIRTSFFRYAVAQTYSTDANTLITILCTSTGGGRNKYVLFRE